MSIEPKMEKSSDVAVDEERRTDRPSSTAEIARDLNRPEARQQSEPEEGPQLVRLSRSK